MLEKAPPKWWGYQHGECGSMLNSDSVCSRKGGHLELNHRADDPGSGNWIEFDDQGNVVARSGDTRAPAGAPEPVDEIAFALSVIEGVLRSEVRRRSAAILDDRFEVKLAMLPLDLNRIRMVATIVSPGASISPDGTGNEVRIFGIPVVPDFTVPPGAVVIRSEETINLPEAHPKGNAP